MSDKYRYGIFVQKNNYGVSKYEIYFVLFRLLELRRAKHVQCRKLSNVNYQRRRRDDNCNSLLLANYG